MEWDRRRERVKEGKRKGEIQKYQLLRKVK